MSTTCSRHFGVFWFRRWLCVFALIFAGCQNETAPERGEGELEQVASPLTTAAFSDDFTSTTLGSAWTVTGTVFASSNAAYQGTYGVRLNGTASLELRTSTTGLWGITLEYARRSAGLDSNEALAVEWLDGTTWRSLESTRSTSWAVQNFALPAAAENRSDLRIRFTTNANFVWETADVDSVRVKGFTQESSSSLVSVQLNNWGYALMNYVRGATHFPSGYPQFAQQQLGLPRYTFGSANFALAAPSAIFDTANDQIIVASAHASSSSGTTIYVIRAGYPSMLPEATPTVIATRPGVIQSPVRLTRWGSAIAATWVEDSVLVYARSTNGGTTWSAPAAFSNVFIINQFAVTGSGNDLYVAYDWPDGALPNNWIFVTRIAANGTGSSIGTVANLPNTYPIRGLSIAANNGDLFTSYATSKVIDVVKWTGFSPSAAQTANVSTLSGTSTSENHSVTIQPSPHGWAIQYVRSNVVSGARQYSTYGYRSDDGLNYGGTQFLWQTINSFAGGSSMSVTPIATPWIVKLHDSGADKNSVYNFIIAGEGFTYSERQKFLDKAQILANNLLSRAPFYFNKNSINVWAVAGYSKQPYYDDNTWGSRDTLFDGARDGTTNIVSSGRDPMNHAVRMLHDRTFPNTGGLPTRNYGVTIYNSPPGKFVGILPWDTSGVPVAPDRVHSAVVIHEFSHTHNGGFTVGDHELYNQSDNVNKSFDGRVSATASPPHAWQEWFNFASPAVSRLIPVTEAFRADSSQPPYSPNPASPSFVSALDYLNPGLWESWRAGATATTRQYTMLHACMMNTNAPRSEVYCPICSERIASVLETNAGRTFTRAAFRGAQGAYLEFPLQVMSACGNEVATPANLNLSGLIRVRSGSGAWVTVPPSAIEVNDFGGINDASSADMGRVNLGSWVTPGQVATVAFQTRSSGDPARFVYLPSVQVVNSKGARYPIEPADSTIASALQQKVYDVNCGHTHWDLAANGELRLSFTPH